MASRKRKPVDNVSVEIEVSDELGFHLEMRTRELIAKGMHPDRARAEALRRFGDMGRVNRQCRKIAKRRNSKMQFKEQLSELRQDFLFALRQTKSNLGLSALVVLTLGLGIGANAAVFSIVNAVLIRPLPLQHPERLVRLYELTPEGGQFSTSEPNFVDFRDRNRTLSDLAALAWPAPQLTLLSDQAPESWTGAAVTGSTFRVLKMDPVLGRTFADQEERPGVPSRVIVLSRSLWQNRFGSDPDILGRTLNLNGEDWTVIGVVPDERTFLSGTQAWIPFAPNPAGDRSDHRLEVFGRIKPGVTLEQARQDMSALADQLSEDYPASNRDWGVQVLNFEDWLVGPRARQAAWVLQCSVGLMLLLACANVSNLLIARATSRQREMALRTALGAGRLRIIRQLLTESIFLSALGAAAGLLLAFWCIPLIAGLGTDSMPRINEVSLDLNVLAFLVTTALAVGILSGIAPAVQASRASLSDVLRSAHDSSTFGARRFRSALVAAELALALMLLIAAGLLLRSFRELTTVDPGFKADDVWALSLALPENRYSQGGSQTRAFYRRLIERVEAIAGVESAAAGIVNPLRGPRPSNWVGAETARELSEFVQVQWRVVSEGYFQTLSVPLLQGRTFDRTDRVEGDGPPGSDTPAVISAQLAGRIWDQEQPVGKRIRWNRPDGSLLTVVGVVGDMRDVDLQAEPPPMIYLSLETVPMPAMTFFVRSKAGLPVPATALREAVWAVDKDLPAPQPWPLEQNLSSALSGSQLNTRLMGAFAAIALAIACMGIYGIMSYAVARRQREIGVRMAMGARPANMVRLVLRQGLALVAAGTVVGIAGAWILTRFLGSMLYQTSPTHLATFAALTLALGLVGTLAGIIPALKAARIDPCVSLRSE